VRRIAGVKGDAAGSERDVGLTVLRKAGQLARSGKERPSGGLMARHNRVARGEDQRGDGYEISYQPDWLRRIKVTRTLTGGRQSTKTLFQNATRAEQGPGPKVRTRVTSQGGDIDFEVEVEDPRGIVTRVIVETMVPAGERKGRLLFSIENGGAPRVRRPRR
jgi:hypothetical protein